MKLLVTAGNTLAPIDRVRAITNIFTGRTGARIALTAHDRGHAVTLLTSKPEAVRELRPDQPPPGPRWASLVYATFDDLGTLMEDLVRNGGYDVVIHSAAVSDYRVAGVYSPAARTHFRTDTLSWEDEGGAPGLEDRAAGKVKSDHPELWLRLVKSPKLIDHVRRDWAFKGVLVKFKLEVGVSEDELLRIAESSRQQSAADLMAANTLGRAEHFWAYLGPVGGRYERLSREDLAGRLLAEVERLHAGRTNG